MNDHQWSAAAHAQEAQDIAAQIIRRRVSAILERRYGADWQRIVVEKMREKDRNNANSDFKGRILPKFENGKYEFDFIQIVHALNDCLPDLPELRSKQRDLGSVLYNLRKGRNKLAHKVDDFDINDAEFAKKHIKNILTVCSILASESEEDIQAVKRLMERLSRPQGTKSTTAPAAPATSELSDIRAMLEVVMRKLEAPAAPAPAATHPSASAAPAPGSPDPAPPAPDSVDASRRLAAAGRDPLVRRRGPVPPAKPGLCLFPIVAEGDGAEELGEIGYVNCGVYTPESRQPYLSRVTGLPGARADVYYQVIDDARFDEPDSAKAMLHTHARIDPGSFNGASFGLAAAIADRGARYGCAEAFFGRPLIATGILVREGGGAVAKIDSFGEKLKLIRDRGPAGAIFIYPAANAEAATPEVRGQLDELSHSGHCLLVPIRHFSDLAPLFATSASPMPASGPEARATDSPPVNHDRPAATGRRRQATRLGLIAAPIVGAVLVLLALYYAAMWSQAARPSAEQRQRIDDLTRIARAVDPSKATAGDCRQLDAAAGALTAEERSSLDGEGLAALAAARQCGGLLKDSDARLQRVADALAGIGRQGANLTSCSALDVATAMLQPFDATAADNTVDQATNRQCSTILAESDARLAAITQAMTRLAAVPNDLAACTDLRTAFDQLSEADRRRLAARDDEAGKVSTQCAAQLADSESRRSTALYTVQMLDASDPATVSAVRDAVAVLRAEDLALLPDAQRNKLLQDADNARQILVASDARLAVVGAAYRHWQQTPTSQSETALLRAVESLSTFDRMRPSQQDVGAAIAALTTLKVDMDGRSQRWNRLAQMVRQARGRSPADYWQGLDDAVGRLTPQDRASATLEQKLNLSEAQKLLDQTSRNRSEFGTIPATSP